MSSELQRAIFGCAVLALVASPAWGQSAHSLDLAVVPPPEEIEIVIAHRDGRLERHRRQAMSDGRLAMPGGCVEGAAVWVLSANTVSPPIVVGPESPCFAGLPHRVELLEAVEISGSLTEELPQDDHALPLVDAPECEPTRSAEAAPAFFPLILRGTAWHARLPRGCRLLRLRLGAATPVSLGPVQLREDAQWPPLRLSRRAAVAGRVVQAETGHAMPDAQVWVVQNRFFARAITTVLRGEELSSLTATTADARGWFRLPDLPEDSLRLLVTSPGRAPAWSAAFDAQRGAEQLVPSLQMERAGSLHVFTEATGQLLVSASAMLPESSLPEALLSVELPPGGPAHLDGLFSGDWLLELIATEPPDRLDVLARMPVHLLPGEDRVVSFLPSEPPYRGRVIFEGEGVAARLRFSPDRPGKVAVTHSAADGTFFVWLEAPGRYHVEVFREDLSAVVPEVEMRYRDEPVAIELPEGRISGRVEADGEPAPAVLVEGLNVERVFGQEGGRAATTSTETDAEGRFILRGLVRGEWVLRARTATSASRPATVSIGDDGEATDVRILLESTTTASVRLLAPSGAPVAGARVAVAAVPEAPVPAEVREAASAADGGFRIEVPPGSSALNVAVHAAGHPAYAWRLPAGGSAELRLPAQGGSARIALAPSAVANLPALVLATPGGGLLSLSDLVAWGGASLTPHGEGLLLEIGELASGTWRLHRPESMDEAASLLRFPAATASVAVFEVPPEGQVELSVP